MFAMAAVGLIFALSTRQLRESRHPTPLAAVNQPHSYAPAKLPGLGYLPDDTNIVAGIHLAELRRDKLAARLLQRPLPGPLAQTLDLVERRSGLKLDAIDLVVCGTTLTDEVPQLTIVVHTTLPYSGDELRRLYPQKPIAQHQRPMFRVKLEPAGGGYIWCAEPRTLVMTLRPDAAKIEDMDRIPATPRKGDQGLRQSLIELLEKRLRGSMVWIAGDLDETRLFEAVAAFSRVPDKQLDLLRNLRGFSLGVLSQEDLTLIGALKARDSESAAAWRGFLEAAAWSSVKSKKIVGAPKDTPEANWVNFQVRAEPGGIRAALEALIQPAQHPANGKPKHPE
jgi:hypothetical protein